MIRKLVCLATFASLVACGSSGPRRPPVPTDPALITLGSYGSNQYLQRHYGTSESVEQTFRQARSRNTGLHAQRFYLSKHLAERSLVSEYTAGNRSGPKTLADFYVIDVIFESIVLLLLRRKSACMY